MHVEITTANKFYSFDSVQKVVYHTSDGDITFTDIDCIHYDKPRTAITIYTPDREYGIANQPFITKVVR